MEVRTEKSKIMANSMNIISADIIMNGQKLEEVISFKYVGATLCKNDPCSAEARPCQNTAHKSLLLKRPEEDLG